MADVDAVIDGLFAGGAGTVLVKDGHGSGCDADPDLPADRLDKRASYVDLKSDTTPLWQRQWDALVWVGQHAGSGTGGFLPHTAFYGFTRLVNGRPISESEMQAYFFGEYGIPMIFASGDDVLGASLRKTMPWIEYVQVKRAVSVSSAILGDAKTTVRALPPLTSFRVLDGVPGVVLRDETVEFTAADFEEARRGWSALVRVGITVLRLDQYDKPEKKRTDAWLEAEALAARKTPPR